MTGRLVRWKMKEIECVEIWWGREELGGREGGWWNRSWVMEENLWSERGVAMYRVDT